MTVKFSVICVVPNSLFVPLVSDSKVSATVTQNIKVTSQQSTPHLEGGEEKIVKLLTITEITCKAFVFDSRSFTRITILFC